VSASPPTKVSARRYLAHLIDGLIRVAAWAVPFALLADRTTVNAVDPTIADRYREYGSFALAGDRVVRVDDRLYIFEREELFIIGGIALAVVLFFDVIIQGRFGWTVGTLLTGLRTVKKTGERPGIIRAFVRTLLLPIDLIPGYLIPLVGGLFIFASDTNRRLGDLCGGTYVVDKSSWGIDPTVDDDVDRTAWEGLDDHPGHVTRLDEGEPLRVGAAAGAAATAVPERADDDDSKAPAYQPQWDPARKAYLQWDPRKQTWLQFDDDAGEWRPIG
jgi:uncharacterized RDD family membrane protein YckC